MDAIGAFVRHRHARASIAARAHSADEVGAANKAAAGYVLKKQLSQTAICDTSHTDIINHTVFSYESCVHVSTWLNVLDLTTRLLIGCQWMILYLLIFFTFFENWVPAHRSDYNFGCLLNVNPRPLGTFRYLAIFPNFLLYNWLNNRSTIWILIGEIESTGNQSRSSA